MKKRKQLALLLAFTLSLTNPMIKGIRFDKSTVYAASDYKVYREIHRYKNADDASKNINSVGFYSPRNYYIYKSYKGMLNISLVEGRPGSWINPEENKEIVETTEVTTIPTTTIDETTWTSAEATTITTTESTGPINTSFEVGSSYKLLKTLPVYMNADYASKRLSPLTYYKPGDYFIYKKYNGMLNITRVKGRAGAWINPKDNPQMPEYSPGTTSTSTSPITKSTSTVTSSPKTTIENTSIPTTEITTSTSKSSGNTNRPLLVGDLIRINSSISIYNNAIDAKNRLNSIRSYKPGLYYIYKIYGGMYNISQNKGLAGAWVNLTGVSYDMNINSNTSTEISTTNSTVTTSQSTSGNSKPRQVPIVGESYELYKETDKFNNAGDAKRRVSALGKLSPGSYYVYKIYDDMINLTKKKGLPGSWINPYEESYLSNNLYKVDTSNLKTNNYYYSFNNGAKGWFNNKVDNIENYGALKNLSGNTIAYTFDLGYSTGYEDKVLDVLKEKGIKATFFTTGTYLRDNPRLVKRIIEEGHKLACHSYNHDSVVSLVAYGSKSYVDDINRWFKYSPVETDLIRFPEGVYSNRALEITKDLNLKAIFWDVSYYDYNPNNQPTYNGALTTLKGQIRPGSIMLLHVFKTNAEVLSELIEYTNSMGLIPVQP